MPFLDRDSESFKVITTQHLLYHASLFIMLARKCLDWLTLNRLFGPGLIKSNESGGSLTDKPSMSQV